MQCNAALAEPPLCLTAQRSGAWSPGRGGPQGEPAAAGLIVVVPPAGTSGRGAGSLAAASPAPHELGLWRGLWAVGPIMGAGAGAGRSRPVGHPC